MERLLKITLYKDLWIICDAERYLEKVAVDCHGVRAELLSYCNNFGNHNNNVNSN